MDFVINTGTTSVSSIQRKFSVGFNRAARIMDQMEEQGLSAQCKMVSVKFYRIVQNTNLKGK